MNHKHYYEIIKLEYPNYTKYALDVITTKLNINNENKKTTRRGTYLLDTEEEAKEAMLRYERIVYHPEFEKNKLLKETTVFQSKEQIGFKYELSN